ncbi:MAG: TRM11 family SAM-dependent methyltransferase [Candidatus Dormibacteria bacterium]
MRYFALAVPGVGTLVAEEISRHPAFAPSFDGSFDGRNDVVPFVSVKSTLEPFDFRSCEDVYVEVALTTRATDLPQLVRDLSDDKALARGLSIYAHYVRRLHPRMRYRVVTRVRSERRYRRTQLRDALVGELSRQRPKWLPADPAELEIWVLETKPGLFRSGIRLTDASMRHRAPREIERIAALRPSVAGAMVTSANLPPGATLLDPFCGSGTILREALSLGLRAVGSDNDPVAVEAARVNAPAATVDEADARQLPFADGVVDAVVTNLPFGGTYRISAPLPSWFREVLGELRRVTRAGGTITLLVPVSDALTGAIATNDCLQIVRRMPVRLLGFPTCIWQLRRKYQHQ